MKHPVLPVCAGALLVAGVFGGYYGVRAANAGRAAVPSSVTGAEEAAPERRSPGSSASAPSDAPPGAEPLAWSELLEPGVTLAPSARSRALAGKRVRLVGFMAQMELPIAGAFYLVPRPIACDEAGDGTADLMPASVLVISESAAGKDVAFVPGALDVSGVLEVGNQPGPDGRVSAFRLRLDAGPASVRAADADAPNGSGSPTLTRFSASRRKSPCRPSDVASKSLPPNQPPVRHAALAGLSTL